VEQLNGSAVPNECEVNVSAKIVQFPVSGAASYEAAIDALTKKAIADALRWSRRQEPQAFATGPEENLVLIVAGIAVDMLEVAASRLRTERQALEHSSPRA
jgi:hypothetical protein